MFASSSTVSFGGGVEGSAGKRTVAGAVLACWALAAGSSVGSASQWYSKEAAECAEKYPR